MVHESVPVEDPESLATLREVEQSLSRSLIAWSLASVGLGTACAVAGSVQGRPAMVAFGRQTVAWGAIDGLIAGAATMSQRRRGVLDRSAARQQVQRVRRILEINAVADIGYIAGGLLIAARGRSGRRTARMGTGDGVAIVLQGAFLLVLDTSQARRLR